MSGGGYEEGIIILWGILLWRGFSWICTEGSLSSVVGRISIGDTDLLGVLGTGARISIWYPGAR
jgi:hypothetical protein